MRLRIFWNRLRGLHDDGSKHTWVRIPFDNGFHWCEWDYCHCWLRKCTSCGKKQQMSAGSLEMR